MEATAATKTKKARKQSQFMLVMKRMSRNKSAMVGLAILLLLIVAAILAPVLTPYGYSIQDMTSMHATPSLAHPFGCDSMGRDLLSRCLYGARYSLSLGLISAFASVICGIVIGSIAGYFGGAIDMVILRLMDILQGIPSLLLAIAISTALGGGFGNTILAMSVGGIPQAVRLLRANVLSIHDAEYLEAARAINCSKPRIIFKHTIPNSVAPLIVSLTMGIGNTIMGASMLSYIGLGIRPPLPEWGAMLSNARDFVRDYPHEIIFPGLCILVTVLCLNMLGDGLRDAMDPKLKN